MNDLLTVLCGDALDQLRTLPNESVQCCVTSPPYWGLRDYGTAKWEGGDASCDHTSTRRHFTDATSKQGTNAGSSRDPIRANCRLCGARRIDAQIGLEATPEEYVAKLVDVFRGVRRVLRNDGTLWLNLGDSYCANGKGGRDEELRSRGKSLPRGSSRWGGGNNEVLGLKCKDLVGIPWMVAFALRADGWYLRSDIIWHKPNPMPESVTDRPTKSHEYIFLLTKSPRYFYDANAIKEECKDASIARLGRGNGDDHKQLDVPGRTPNSFHAPRLNVKFGGNNRCPDTRLQSGKNWTPEMSGAGTSFPGHSGSFKADGPPMNGIMVNKKSVWTVPTPPFKDAHFATYPPDLIKPCILAGSKPGDVILDPFAGSGTTGMVALELGRKALLIELNPQYVELIRRRCDVTPGLALA